MPVKSSCCLRYFAQCPEAVAKFFRKELRLLPGSKVPTFVKFVVMDEGGVRFLCPTARALIELVWEGAHGNRDADALGTADALDTEIRELIFPVETGSGKRRVRQPSDRNVVEDIVPGEAGSFSGKDT